MAHINIKTTTSFSLQQHQQFSKIKQDHTFLDDIKFLLWTVKITGLLPNYNNINEYEIEAPTRNSKIYTYFIRCVIFSLIAFNLYTYVYFNPFDTYENQHPISNNTDMVTTIVEVAFATFVYVAIICNNSWNSKQLITIINDLLEVDQEINKRKNSIFLENNCAFSKKFIIGMILCQTYMSYLETTFENGVTPTAFSITVAIYNLQNTLSGIFIVLLSTLLRIVAMRFAYLNAILRKYSNDSRSTSNITTSCYEQKIQVHQQQEQHQQRQPLFVHRYQQQKEKQENIESDSSVWQMFSIETHFCYGLHSKLVHTYKSINDFCGLIIALYLGFTFYSVTGTLYYIFVQISGPLEFPLALCQVIIVWLGFNFSIITLLARNCHQASKEANNTATVLARVYHRNKQNQNIIDKYLTKCVRQEVQFTAYGFFTIDNTTLFKIFSAVTTYLVILIQFMQLEEAKNEERHKIQS